MQTQSPFLSSSNIFSPIKAPNLLLQRTILPHHIPLQVHSDSGLLGAGGALLYYACRPSCWICFS